MAAQGRTERRPVHIFLLWQHLSFNVCQRIGQLRHHLFASASQPFEMAARKIEILQRVPHRIDFFETAIAGPLKIARAEASPFPSCIPCPTGPPGHQPLEQHRPHGEREGRVKNPSQRPQTAPPGRIKNLLVVIVLIHHVFAQQQIEVMVAVLVDQIVDQVEPVTVKTIDGRQPGAMPVAEAHHTGGVERYDTRGQ